MPRIDHDAGAVGVVVHWKGGGCDGFTVPLRRRRSAPDDGAGTVALVRQPVGLHNDDGISGALNRRGPGWLWRSISASRSGRSSGVAGRTSTPDRQKPSGGARCTGQDSMRLRTGMAPVSHTPRGNAGARLSGPASGRAHATE